jgi:hypothetical protein
VPLGRSAVGEHPSGSHPREALRLPGREREIVLGIVRQFGE